MVVLWVLLLVDTQHLDLGTHKIRGLTIVGNLLSLEEIRDSNKWVLTLQHRMVARVQTLGIQVIGSAIGTINMVS